MWIFQVKTGFYWQTIIEDSSGREFRNIKDGLWGIYIHSKDKDRLINGLVYEFINTTDQSGIWFILDTQWNKVFLSGSGGKIPFGLLAMIIISTMEFTSLAGLFIIMVLGTPLITSPSDLRSMKAGMRISGIIKLYAIILDRKAGTGIFSINYLQHII